MPLTDRLRAAAFARDKGICAFSGLSVWILDHGTAPFWHPDWADHIYPVSRGGKDHLDNLVCASYFHNVKKLNNSADRVYLFRNGLPTEEYFYTYGELSSSQANLLKSHSALTESDWYFNRALYNLLIAVETGGLGRTRTPEYWIRSAFKRLERWRSVAEQPYSESFITRGLVRFSRAPDVLLMLSVAEAEMIDLARIVRRLAQYYNANDSTLRAFLSAKSHERRTAILERAKVSPKVTEPLLAPLKLNLSRLRWVRNSASSDSTK
jgi:hypothetical protein